MVGDISCVTLNKYQKFLLCISSQGQDLYSHQKLNMYIYWFSSTDAADDDNAEHHSTTTRATYRQQVIWRFFQMDLICLLTNL